MPQVSAQAYLGREASCTIKRINLFRANEDILAHITFGLNIRAVVVSKTKF